MVYLKFLGAAFALGGVLLIARALWPAKDTTHGR